MSRKHTSKFWQVTLWFKYNRPPITYIAEMDYGYSNPKLVAQSIIDIGAKVKTSSGAGGYTLFSGSLIDKLKVCKLISRRIT